MRGGEGNLLSWAVSWGFWKFDGRLEKATGTEELEDNFAGSSFTGKGKIAGVCLVPVLVVVKELYLNKLFLGRSRKEFACGGV